MQASTLRFTIAVVVRIVTTTPAFARPMHAGIDYQRYLEEIDTTQADLDEWRSKYGDVAQKNGWMPVSEDRSADDQEEDLCQRIFLTKQNIATVQTANPDANFYIMSPFSAMTNDEFNTYVLNSYVRGNSTQSSRQLRSTANSDLVIDGSANSASWMQASRSFIRSLINLDTGTIQPASDSSANVSSGTSGSQASYQFSDFWNWRPYKPTRTPTTSAPTVTEESTVSSGGVDWSTTECFDSKSRFVWVLLGFCYGIRCRVGPVHREWENVAY